MKRWWTAAAIALAVSVFACMVESPEEEIIRFDPQGRRLVRLSIGVGAQGRALSDLIADACINYYEVIIAEGNNIYRATSRTNTLTIDLPTTITVTGTATVQGTANIPNALVFAGYRRVVDTEDYSKPENYRRLFGVDAILLGIGRCVGVYEGATGPIPGGVITSQTTELRFRMVALETKVADANDSDFQVTHPGFLTSGGNHHNTVDDFTYPPDTIIEAYPFFKVPTNVPAISATMVVRNLTTNNAVFTAGNPAAGIWVHPDGFTASTTPISSPMAKVNFVWGGDPIRTKGEVTGMNRGYSIPTGSFSLLIHTDKDDSLPHPDRWMNGWALLALNIPVCMFQPLGGANFDTGRSKPADRNVWHIRTGMYSSLPDHGINPLPVTNDNPNGGRQSHSMGGGILLSVGDPDTAPRF